MGWRGFLIFESQNKLIVSLPLIERAKNSEAVLINTAAIVIKEWKNTDAQDNLPLWINSALNASQLSCLAGRANTETLDSCSVGHFIPRIFIHLCGYLIVAHPRLRTQMPQYLPPVLRNTCS